MRGCVNYREISRDPVVQAARADVDTARRGRPRGHTFRFIGVLAAALPLVGCGSSGGDGGGGGGGGGLPQTSRTGTVVLPAGSATPLSSLKVLNSLGERQVGADGKFTIDAYADGPQLTVVLSPAGNPLLVGYTDAANLTVNSRSTAEALVFLASGSYANDSPVQARALELLRTEARLTPLVGAIDAAVATSPDCFAADAPAVRQALHQAVLDLYRGTRAIRFDPTGYKSGIRLDIVGDAVNTVRLVNTHRRPAHAYVRQVSYVDENNVVHAEARDVGDFKLPGTAGASGVISSLVDYFSGTVAYGEVAGPDVALENRSGRKRTTYKFLAIGPAPPNRTGDWNQLTADMQTKQRMMTGTFIARDLVLPLLLSVVMPIYTGGEMKHEDIGNDLETLPVFVDFVGAMMSLEGVASAVEQGDVAGAVRSALTNVGSAGTFQTIAYNLLRSYVREKLKADPTAAFVACERVQILLNAVGVANIALAAGDLGVVATHFGMSDAANVWTVDATPANVRITPPDSVLPIGASIVLKVSAPDVGSAANLAYRWRTPGLGGDLSDALHSGKDFSTTSDTVTYTANTGRIADDAVYCDVSQLEGTVHVPIGTAQAVVRIRDVKVRLTPSAADLTGNAHPAFTATVTGVEGDLEFEWKTSDRLRNSAGHWRVAHAWSTDTDMAYGRRDGSADTHAYVRVAVRKLWEGRTFILGEATARINQKKYAIPAGQHGEVVRDYDHNASGYSYGCMFPKDPEATRYTVTGSGFNDPYAYGTSLSFTVPPGANFHDRGTSWYVTFTSGGGSGIDQRSDDEILAWARGRFAGGVFEAEPHYPVE